MRAILAVMAFSLSSCAGFLDEEMESQYDMKDFYKDTEEMESGLLGVYSQAKKLYQGNSLPITILGTDELYATNTTGNFGIADLYLYPASNPSTTNWYQSHYQVIQSANIVIEVAPGVPGITPEDRDRIVAEARVIRAWCYFRLVQTFGRVPLMLTQTQSNFNSRIRRHPIAEVYQAVIDDLKFACADGVLTEDINLGHINHWVAKGMLAKVYLTLGTSMTRRPQPIDEYRELPFDPEVLFKDCRDLCDEVIASGKYTLAKNYSDNFTIGQKNGSESMWELQYSSSPKMGAAWSKNFGVSQMGYPNAYTQNCLVGNGYFSPLPSFYRVFKLGDTRRTWSIADYRVQFDAVTQKPVSLSYISAEKISTGEFCDLDTDDPDLLERTLVSTPAKRIRVSKYRWGLGGDPSVYWQESLSFESGNAPNNVVVLRYADVLLMRIEADMLMNRGVAGTESLDIMNDQLLARARGWNGSTGAYTTEAEMLESVLATYAADVAAAQELYDADPSNPTLAENLRVAREKYETRKGRCLVNYTSQTLTYEELLKQRACELCFEFHRWFDLSRTGTLHTAVAQRKVYDVPAVEFSYPTNYLLPIPTYDLDLAGDKTLFYQNPGY